MDTRTSAAAPSEPARQIPGWAIAAGMAGPVVFALGWGLAGMVEGHGYSPVADTISDLGARTASHPAWYLACEVLAGVCSILFTIFALRPSVAPSRARTVAVASQLISSLPDLLAPLTRLDCRRVDGCSVAQQTASPAGQVEQILSLVSFVVLLVSGIALAQALRHQEGWRGWPPATIALTILLVGLVFVTGAPTLASTQGLSERAIALTGGLWSIALAHHTLVLHRPTTA